MKKILLFLIFFFLSFLTPNSAFAAASCSGITITPSPISAYTGSGAVTVTFDVNIGSSASLDLSYDYYIALESSWDDDRNSNLQKLAAGANTFTVTIPQNTNANWDIKIRRSDPGPNNLICQQGSYQATKQVPVIHCSNGIKDADETGIDCGGIECIACAAAASVPPAAAVAGTPPCDPEFGAAGTGVSTGLGCMPTTPQDLVKWILKYAILMGGGIAFLLSVFGGVSIILAGGNPEKINAAKEIIGSALTGLLFIIFSVFLLRFIGYDILQLPGFQQP